jgi:hypothetical protein
MPASMRPHPDHSTVVDARAGVVSIPGVSEPEPCDLVHYASYGTPGGEYPPTCRAAIITDAGAWVTVNNPTTTSPGQPRRAPVDGDTRTLTQQWQAQACTLTVFNPGGLFLNPDRPCPYQPPDRDGAGPGGTWHYPEDHAHTDPGAS